VSNPDLEPLVTLQSRGPAGDGRREREVRELGPWFHNLHLPGGLQTAPDHPLGDFPRVNWELLAPHLPTDLHGWRVLDIGCNAGFYTFQLASRGASVLGIDADAHYLAQARWASAQLGLGDRVAFEQREVYELALLSARFDLVLFMGVFYHLRHPLLALEMVADKVQRMLVFQSLEMPAEAPPASTGGHGIDERGVFLDPGWPRMAFVEHDFAGDPTNWWVPNPACVEALLRDVGLTVTSRPGPELYLCAPTGPVDPQDPAARRPVPSYRRLMALLRDERWSPPWGSAPRLPHGGNGGAA
jgi:tRNA (mo5U34)-methyltransferase